MPKEGKNLSIKNISRFKTLLADKAYDSDKIRAYLETKGKIICIPAKSNRKFPQDFDSELYKKRSTIENMFSQLKNWRGIAMRFCRSAHMFDSAVRIALIAIFFNVR